MQDYEIYLITPEKNAVDNQNSLYLSKIKKILKLLAIKKQSKLTIAVLNES
ncbi:hypothetical protein [Coleofasciculus sp. G2-EDA-02]|uniref:hypothetical protein n=1 Tax=Coleofasciculus sp. G2-EDA-02 TaxID=3069529 RepID=UPI00406326C9